MASVKDMLTNLTKKLTEIRKLDAPAMQNMKKMQEAALKAGKAIQDEKG